MTVNSVSSLGYSFDPHVINLENVKKVNPAINPKDFEIKDTFSVQSKFKNEKVSFTEGVKLIGKGFINKIKETGKAIVENPVKSIGVVAGTTLALAALPLIGISAATGAAVLALGFAGYALYNMGKDAIETYEANKEGRYDDVRKGLEKIGGDSVDVALSAPFAPKAVNQISRFAKSGTSTVGLNKDLISNIKNVKDIPLELEKAETKIKYEMITKEMGLKVKPKLEFKEFNTEEGITLGGAYEPTTGVLQVNPKMLTAKGKIKGKLCGLDDVEIIIRHELEHFRQFSDAARAENVGLKGLSDKITEYYNGVLKQVPMEQLEKSGFSKATVENMTTGDKSAFNKTLYQEIIDKNGVIKAGTKESDLAEQYVQGLVEKINPKAEHIEKFKEATKDICPFFITPFDKIKIMKAQMELYKANILEKEAYTVQDIYKNSNITRRPDIKLINAQVLSTSENA